MSKRIIILGAGESGTGAALLAKSKGYDVFVSDASAIKEHFKQELITEGISFEEHNHSIDLLNNAELIIKSPGIAYTILFIEQAQKQGIEIIDELEFAYRFTDKPMIGITGTNGKTTTTLLIHHLLTASGVNAGLAGNVGHSLARQVIKDTAEVYVVEMSSFQLEGIVSFKPKIGIILNITPDHLDRYNNDFELYSEAKLKIAKNMDDKDHLLYYGDDRELMEKAEELENWPQRTYIGFNGGIQSMGYLNENGMYVYTLNGAFEIPSKYWPLKGAHNVLNMLFAINAALIFGLTEDNILAHLPSFKNAPNRMEFIATIKGVDFVNDTKATNVEAVFYALESYANGIVWIVGGQDKGNDYTQIATLVAQNVKAIVCLGLDNKKIINFFGSIIPKIAETQDVKEAVRMAFEYAHKNEAVLLSPACASFDLFENYAQRGELFKEAVFQLKSEIDG